MTFDQSRLALSVHRANYFWKQYDTTRTVVQRYTSKDVGAFNVAFSSWWSGAAARPPSSPQFQPFHTTQQPWLVI